MELLRSFGEISKDDAALAGGKGASLGEMTQAGIPVPPGFVVLSSAFERFLDECDLSPEIDSVFHEVDAKEMHTVERASAKIQELILSSQMPADIAAEIEKYFKELGAAFVAVRSSATAEDSASAAWAGQLDTYLNTTEGELLKNVQRCWASLFTPRAIFYRYEKNLHLQKISVAVVVQKMVQSEISGIAFSVHPVTEDRNQLIIEAGYGLGEAIVSGQVTPDSYVVEKNPRRILDVTVNTQRRALYKAESGGNEWRDIPELQASAQVLSQTQIFSLSELVVRIEKHYGFPCDIEWAFEGGEFYIVQSRPITTLSPAPQKEEYVKEYTRDTTMIIQQAWCTTLDIHRDELGLSEWAGKIQTLHYLRDGVIEIWENKAWTPALMDAMLRENQNNPEHFHTYTKAHEEETEKLKPYWKEGCTADIKKLVEIVDAVFATMHYFDWMYYSSIDDRTPEPLKMRALEMRKRDVYFDETDRFIRRSLLAIYPELKGFEQGILRNEIENPPTLEVLKERAKHFVVVGEHRNFLGTLQEFEAQNPELAFRIETPPMGASDLQGHAGSRGRGRGVVRILKRKDQISELQEGEVLVSTMTTPDFVPAMQKAAAIVTDEGGMMCHAAIVARELQKPCLIGTKFATEVLKDGDLVEVDADAGVVRIVEHA